MLRQLRRRLALICTLTTAAVLVIMAAAALWISEARITAAGEAAFQSNINTIVYKLQSDASLSATWLAQTEISDSLIISIEDGGSPLLFAGAWKPETGRAELIASARETARNRYSLDSGTPPVSHLEVSRAIFPLRGRANERYLAAVAIIPSGKGWQSLTLLRDMRTEDEAIWMQRALFAGLSVLCILFLFGFSWWFSGHAIRPIEESRRKQVEFVAAASHELRSPLAVIRASLGAMRASPRDAVHFMESMDRECSRMGRLVDDLLLLAGSDAGTWNVRLIPVELDTLLIETVEIFLPLAAQENRRLSLCLPDESLPPVPADAERLRQALGVFIDNALHYTPPGSTIVVRAVSIPRGVALEVEDDGPGIPPADAAHIFDRFYRVEKSRTDKTHFGLGLSIAAELIQLHHGKLSYRCAQPHGSIFSIMLPATRAERSK